MNWVYFMGRLHVLVLHLPIGIILAAIAVEWTSRRERFRHLAVAMPFLWCAAAVASIVTAVLGYMHFAEGGFEGRSADAHRIFGTALAVVATVVWLVCVRSPAMYRKIQMGTGIVALALVVATGYYGATLTHGSRFLASVGAASGRDFVSRRDAAPTLDPLTAADTDIAALHAVGFSARRVSRDDDSLIVYIRSAGEHLGTDQLAALLRVAERVVDLNLQNAGLDDADLEGFERFVALERLRLSNNDVTDRGVALLAVLPKLEYLNLYGNARVTDASLETLGSFASLNALHLWETGVSIEGAMELRAFRPDLVVEMGTPAY